MLYHSNLDRLIFAGKLGWLCNNVKSRQIIKDFSEHVHTGFCIAMGAAVGTIVGDVGVAAGAFIGGLVSGINSDKPVGTIFINSVVAGLWPGIVIHAHVVHLFLGLSLLLYNDKEAVRFRKKLEEATNKFFKPSAKFSYM